MYVNNTRIFVKLKYFCFYILNAKTGYKRSHNILKMNSAIETELRNLLDNVNKTLALKMSEKHGLDYHVDDQRRKRKRLQKTIKIQLESQMLIISSRKSWKKMQS
jgi:hypothetical protein